MNIRIPLTTSLLLAAVLPMCAADVTLAWNPSASPAAAGYTLYTGTNSGVYTWSNNVGTNTSFTLSLNAGTYYFAVTAYSSSGEESPFSNEVTNSSQANPIQTTNSNQATNVAPPPAMLVGQSGGETAVTGSTVQLFVDVMGVGPITFQWFDGSNPIPNATNSLLTLNNVSSASAGNYTVQVSNPGGTVTSAIMAVNIVPLMTEAAGTYTGMFAPTNGSGEPMFGENTSGLVEDLVLTSNGMISGTIEISGTDYSATGSFNADGQGSMFLTHAKSSVTNVTLSLTLLNTESSWEITGAVSNGAPGAQWTAPVLAVQTGQLSISSFTMKLPLPNGTSGSVRGTNVGGVFDLQGTLPGGVEFSTSQAASSDGTFPLFVNLTNNTGLVAGWVMFSNEIPYGTITWMRSAMRSGFTNIIEGN